MTQKIYIAGPMSGKEHLNFDAFDFAKEFLQAGGWVAISPADITRLNHGWGKYPPEGPEGDKQTGKLSKAERTHIMNTDLLALSDCDAIFMLHGWQDSPGATVEIAYATFLGIDIHFAEDAYREDDTNIGGDNGGD